ncbi:unnamed protein product, partial [Rotaria magnacalcarata]
IFAGFAYRNQYDTDRALENFQKALWLKNKCAPNDRQSIATALEGLAVVYNDKGYYQNALQHALECLTIREALLPKSHMDLG